MVNMKIAPPGLPATRGLKGAGIPSALLGAKAAVYVWAGGSG